ncbi:MAG: TonB-dependent receptor, partial [Pseudomonadales bacterium]
FAGSALAQEAPQLQLEEVVVTAQKREESLTEAPLTVNLLSGDSMRDAAIFQADELNKLTAGVEIRYEGDSNTGVGIRGVGTFAQQSAPPRVSTYVDDYFIGSQASFAFAAMYDMKQVQILRGPQGTLYGQPSPTGALILETADPNLDEFEGFVRASYQDPNGYNVQGALSVPIIEGKLAARVALLTDDRETGTENITRNLDEARNRDGARVKLLWDVTDTLSAKLGYSYLRSKKSDTYIILESIDPNSDFQLDADDRIALADSPDEAVDKKDFLATLHLEWDAGFGTVSWFSGDFGSDNLRDSDRDSTNYTVGSLPATSTDFVKNVQHELRVTVDPTDWWSFQIGGYSQDSKAVTDVISQTQVPNQGLFTVTLDIPTLTETKAAFMHNDFYISDETTLTVGFRYNEFEADAKNIIDSSFGFGSVLASDNTFSDPVAVLPSPLPCVSDPTQTPPCVNGEVNVDKEWTGTIKLSHSFSDALNVYATVDHGFRPGAPNFDVNGSFQPTVEDPGSDLNFFSGETVDSIEIGAKGSIFEGRGQYTSSVFLSVYEDYQVRPIFQAFNSFGANGAGAVGVISNADVNVDEATQWGIEGELRYLASENLELFGSLAYATVELTDGVVPCTDPNQAEVNAANRFNVCDADGETGSPQPELFATFKADYHQPFEAIGGEWYLSGLVNYRSDIEVTGDNAGRFDSDGYTTLDVFVGVRADTWDAQLFFKNALDEDGILAKRDAASLESNAFAQSQDPAGTALYNELSVIPPRTIGVTVGYYF